MSNSNAQNRGGNRQQQTHQQPPNNPQSQQSKKPKREKKSFPDYILQKARLRKAHVNLEMKAAKKRIPIEYHEFLIYLPQNEKIGEVDLSDTINGDEIIYWYEDPYNLGLYVSAKSGTGSVYLPIEKPYVTVDGRLQMLRDLHEEKGELFEVSPPEFVSLGTVQIVNVTVRSMLGTATGSSEINYNGNSADKTNPVSNAQTSAIGRALGFLGFGLIGTGARFSKDELVEILNGNVIIKDSKTPNTNMEKEKPLNQRNTRGLELVVQVTSNVQTGADGFSWCDISDENGERWCLDFPPTQKSFAESVNKLAVLRVTGHYIPEQRRFLVAQNAVCELISGQKNENKNSNTAG